MNILITGGGGQLGGELRAVLSAGKSELGGLPREYKNAAVAAVKSDGLDITDIGALRRFAKDRPFKESGEIRA